VNRDADYFAQVGLKFIFVRLELLVIFFKLLQSQAEPGNVGQQLLVRTGYLGNVFLLASVGRTKLLDRRLLLREPQKDIRQVSLMQPLLGAKCIDVPVKNADLQLLPLNPLAERRLRVGALGFH
jgi:hypothetical protein